MKLLAEAGRSNNNFFNWQIRNALNTILYTNKSSNLREQLEKCQQIAKIYNKNCV